MNKIVILGRLTISIHATHTGGDVRTFGKDAYPVISIHATHTGGDRQLL